MIEIIIIISIFLVCVFMMTTTIKKEIKNGHFIHSSLQKRRFYVEDYDENIISDIQLSLNRRDGRYKIIFKGEYYLLKEDKVIKVFNYFQ